VKLNELIYEMGDWIGPMDGHGINLSQFKNFQPLGDENSTIEQLYVDVSSVVGGCVLFRMHKDGEVASMLLGAIVSPGIKGKTTIQVKRTWTETKHRNNGYITSLIAGLYRKWNYAIVSDTKMTSPTISVWRKLHSILKPELYNTTSKQVYTHGEYEFTDDFKDSDNVFLLEHSPHLHETPLPLPWTSAHLVSDYIIYTGKNGLP
jgi:hypothetical protein